MSIEFIPAVCPKCGGELRVPSDKDIVKCMYCGVDVVLNISKENNFDALKMMDLATSSLQAGNSVQAFDYFSRILEQDPNNGVVWLGKATATAMQSTFDSPRFHEAIAYLKKGLQLLPTHPEVKETMVQNLTLILEKNLDLLDDFKHQHEDRAIMAVGQHNDYTFFNLMDERIEIMLSAYWELWEIDPSLELAKSILKYTNMGAFGLNPIFYKSGRSLEQLRRTALEKYPDPFGLKKREEERIAIDPLFRRSHFDKIHEEIIRDELKKVASKYYSGCSVWDIWSQVAGTVKGNEDEFDPTRSVYAWGIVRQEDPWWEREKWDPQVEVIILYDKDENPERYQCIRKGYQPHHCAFSKEELAKTLEKLHTPSAKSIDELRKENEYRKKLIVWENLPWWKKIITERPQY